MLKCFTNNGSSIHSFIHTTILGFKFEINILSYTRWNSKCFIIIRQINCYWKMKWIIWIFCHLLGNLSQNENLTRGVESNKFQKS